jgi:hypothetical protein
MTSAVTSSRLSQARSQADAVAHLPVVHRHLLGPVPGPDHEVDPSAAHQVEDGEVLGEADRVVQRQDERGDQQAQLAGPPGDGGGHHERRGAVPVVGAVVLRQRHHGEAVVLGPGALLERRPVQGLGRRSERRCPQVVAQRQPHARVVDHVPSSSDEVTRMSDSERRVLRTAGRAGPPERPRRRGDRREVVAPASRTSTRPRPARTVAVATAGPERTDPWTSSPERRTTKPSSVRMCRAARRSASTSTRGPPWRHRHPRRSVRKMLVHSCRECRSRSEAGLFAASSSRAR